MEQHLAQQKAKKEQDRAERAASVAKFRAALEKKIEVDAKVRELRGGLN